MRSKTKVDVFTGLTEVTIKTSWFYRKYIFEKGLDLTDARFRLIQGVGPILRVSDRVAQFEWVWYQTKSLHYGLPTSSLVRESKTVLDSGFQVMVAFSRLSDNRDNVLGMRRYERVIWEPQFPPV